MPNVLSIVRRDVSTSSTVFIIAIVAACVVALVFALFAWRFLARQFRRSRVPLPPVQDLAHHREQQAVSFTDRSVRPTTWVDSDPLSQKPRLYSSHFLSVSGSSASLIRNSPDFTPSRGPTRENSWVVEDATSTESSPLPTPLMATDLLPPNPSFAPASKNPLGSFASVASTSDDGISEVHGSPALGVPTSPSDATHSAESSMSSPFLPARPRPPRPSRSRTRTTSIISSSGTVNSIHSVGNTLRGPAHSIHSNVQIVLPAPLAPHLYSSPEGPAIGAPGPMRRSASLYSTTGDRKSVADQWVMVGSRSQTSVQPTGPRLSSNHSRSNLSVTSVHMNAARRSQSQSAIHRDPRRRSPSPAHTRAASSSALTVPQFAHSSPPVPPLPSPYRTTPPPQHHAPLPQHHAPYLSPPPSAAPLLFRGEPQRGRPPVAARLPEPGMGMGVDMGMGMGMPRPGTRPSPPPPSAFTMAPGVPISTSTPRNGARS